MRFRLIDAAKEEFPVQRLCKVLEVSQSGSFAWKSRPASRRQREDLVLLAPVRLAFQLSNGTSGSPRMTRELQDQGPERRAAPDGPADARERAQGSAEAALQAHHRQPSCLPVAPNLLDQDFSAERPDEKGGADISYVWRREGWLYLAVVIDLFARRVVGWAVSDRLHKERALTALRRALAIRRPPAGLTHHSDSQSAPASSSWAA